MKITHVVVDSHDGFTFWKDARNERFTLESARRFVKTRTEDRRRAFKIYELVEVQ